MLSNLVSNKENTFKNPFDEINANSIDPDKILDWWCDPFSTIASARISGHEFATKKLPIILQGSRGSGKTTILKYYSYPILKERAKRAGAKIADKLKDEGHLGFYFRCEDSFINTFESVFSSQSKDKWLSFFEHYLELQFSKQLISAVKDIIFELEDSDCVEKSIIQEINQKFTLQKERKFSSLKDIYSFIIEQLGYVDEFKTETIFGNAVFNPTYLLELYSLSESIIVTLKNQVPALEDVLILFLVDEFENMPENIQRFFNNKIKFVRTHTSFRIGRRSEGAMTTETINDTEYLRENHDYQLVVIDQSDKGKNAREYFLEIANKRLQSVDMFPEVKSIIEILGDKEDKVQEAVSICKGKIDHVDMILKEKDELKNDEALRKQILDIIKYPENPIAESLNAIWVIRSNDNLLETAVQAKDTMIRFFAKNCDDEKVKKYNNDYTNKYKNAITILLAFLYKKKKLYYSFTTILHLCDGNTRTFLNICHAIISDALFYEKESFLNKQQISIESQNRAIAEFSSSEFESICSIINYGTNIRNLVLNIGDVLIDYHKDKKARYPETTQFSFDYLKLDGEIKKIIEIAISWSIIIKREKTKRITAGFDKKGDIYYINKCFVPMFGISCVFRGGVNPVFSVDEIMQMSMGTVKIKKIDKNENLLKSRSSSKKSNLNDVKQISLFGEDENE